MSSSEIQDMTYLKLIHGEEEGQQEEIHESIQVEVAKKEKKEKEKPLVIAGERDTVVSEIVRARALHSVPAKSLLRFRSVSNDWNKWISNPFFAHSHAQHARALSGVFFEDPVVDTPLYAPFSAAVDGLPDPSLSFLPEPVFVLASAYGLLACRGRRSFDYYVVNPLTMSWSRLPEPARYHGVRLGVAIVIAEPIAYNFEADWFLVCLFPIANDLEGVYGVEKFSSRGRKWLSSDQLCFTQGIETSSGVSAGGVAYWRTTTQSVVAYDPAKDDLREISWPAAYEPVVRWEIGELGRRLCCVCVRGQMATVYKLEEEGWVVAKKVVGLKGLDGYLQGEAVPIRVQGEGEMLLLEGGTVAARRLVGDGVRTVEGLPPPARCEEFVPYIATFVDVKKFVY